MKLLFIVALFVLFFTGCSLAVVVTFEQTLEAGQVGTHKFGPIPPRLASSVIISMTAAYDIQVCLQQFVALKGNLQDCAAGNYFYFAASNSSATVFSMDNDANPFGAVAASSNPSRGDTPFFTSSYSTSLLPGMYYASVAYNSTGSLGNSSYELQIVYSDLGCPMGQIGNAQGNCVAAPVVTQNFMGNVQQNSTQYLDYSVQSQSPQSLAATVMATLPADLNGAGIPNGTVEVYLRQGNSPNSEQFNAMGVYNGQPLVLSIQNPQHGDWYLSVNNKNNATLAINVTFSSTSCPNMTFGTNCTGTAIDLSAVFNATQFVGTNDYTYFSLSSTATLLVGTGTNDLEVEAPIILASVLPPATNATAFQPDASYYPTNTSYQLRSMGGSSNFISAQADFNATWHISVWAPQGMVFMIWANTPCPSNCQGESSTEAYGTCDSYSGVCTCDSRYGDLTCTQTGLAVVWIVLISVAAAIILAIAIGVPVACYLRNKQRARYERV